MPTRGLCNDPNVEPNQEKLIVSKLSDTRSDKINQSTISTPLA